MEPTKIEKQFRDGLKNHEIQPSPAAWDRLDAMLTVAEKPKRRFNLMPVAASIVGFFIIVTVLIWQSKTAIDSSNDVEVVILKHAIKPINSADNPIVANEIIQKEQKSGVPTQSRTSEKVSNHKLISPIITANQSNVKQENTGVQSSSQSTIINQKERYANVPKKENLQIEANVSSPKQQSKYVDAAALLAEVDSKKTAPKTTINLKQSTYKVNAKALLSQVDGELEQSFRQNVFQRINANYKTIKVAIAERNNK